jgi:succinoglycan biosynthesis transport protein ExoP
VEQPIVEGPDLLQVVRWRWKLVVAISAGVFVLGTIYIRHLPPKYDAQAIVAITPRVSSTLPGADYVTLAAPRYVAYITAPSTLGRVGQSVGIPRQTLTESVTSSLDTGTSNITIAVELDSARKAASVANALAADMVAFSGGDPLLSAEVVAPAVIPSAPSSPLKRLDEAAVLLAGVLIALVVAYVLERRRPRIRVREHLRALGSYPVLGTIPPTPTLRSAPHAPLNTSSDGSTARLLAMNFERAVEGQSGHVFVVTSSTPGEGKSTVAQALSQGIAGDAEVLLVDGDLYRAGVSRATNNGMSGGFAELLHGKKRSIANQVKRDRRSGVSILPTSPDRTATGVLQRRFSDLMQQAVDGYKFIIVDVPSILEADAGRIMAMLSDGVVFVVSAGTPIAAADEALATLRALNVPVVGIVGNRMHPYRN